MQRKNCFCIKKNTFLENFRAATHSLRLSAEYNINCRDELRMLDHLRACGLAFFRQVSQSFRAHVINDSFAFTRARHDAAVAAVFAGASSTSRRHSFAASNSPTFCVGKLSRGPQPYYPYYSHRIRLRCSRRPHCFVQWQLPCAPSRCRGPTR